MIYKKYYNKNRRKITYFFMFNNNYFGHKLRDIVKELEKLNK